MGKETALAEADRAAITMAHRETRRRKLPLRSDPGPIRSSMDTQRAGDGDPSVLSLRRPLNCEYGPKLMPRAVLRILQIASASGGEFWPCS
ncbi:MAG: hypothetical protein QOD94_303, partial [Alphaproteobacteria bacterium]|nr:hypothetical protein [Alphaproteobacteria bacterium]